MKGAKIVAAIIVIIIIAGVGYYGYHYETTGKLKVSTDDMMLTNTTNATYVPDASGGHFGFYVTFSAIALHSASHNNTTGWTNYSLHDKTINVLDLSSSNASLLSNLSVHAGTYNMVKIYIKKISVDFSALGFTSNTTLTLSSPVALVIHTITVSAHSTTSMIIDIHEGGVVSSTSTFDMHGNITIVN